MKIAKVVDCVAYMERLGWHFQYFNRPWYVFHSSTRTTWSGVGEMSFTITELRRAFNNGYGKPELLMFELDSYTEYAIVRAYKGET